MPKIYMRHHSHLTNIQTSIRSTCEYEESEAINAWTSCTLFIFTLFLNTCYTLTALRIAYEVHCNWFDFVHCRVPWNRVVIVFINKIKQIEHVICIIIVVIVYNLYSFSPLLLFYWIFLKYNLCSKIDPNCDKSLFYITLGLNGEVLFWHLFETYGLKIISKCPTEFNF